jgi:hypothetical protein
MVFMDFAGEHFAAGKVKQLGSCLAVEASEAPERGCVEDQPQQLRLE